MHNKPAYSPSSNDMMAIRGYENNKEGGRGIAFDTQQTRVFT